MQVLDLVLGILKSKGKVHQSGGQYFWGVGRSDMKGVSNMSESLNKTTRTWSVQAGMLTIVNTNNPCINLFRFSVRNLGTT